MFIIELNEQANTIQVKSNEENPTTIVAQGSFAVDEPDHTVLILFQHVDIAPTNHAQLDRFLSTVITHVGKRYQAVIYLRLPTVFDHRIDMNQLETKNKIARFMAVTLEDLNDRSDESLQSQKAQYELVTDRQLILNYADQLVEMMKRTASWAAKWSFNEICHRIHAATNNVMVLDKRTNTACGFGRLFSLRTDDELFGYLSDIAVDSAHQSKGLGSMLVSRLVGSSIAEDTKQGNLIGTLCLQSVDNGSGVQSAPKVYTRLGFQFIGELGNRIAIFHSRDHYVKVFE